MGHAFDSPGEYDVALRVTDTDAATVTVTMTVTAPRESSLTLSVTGGSGRVGEEIALLFELHNSGDSPLEDIVLSVNSLDDLSDDWRIDPDDSADGSWNLQPDWNWQGPTLATGASASPSLLLLPPPTTDTGSRTLDFTVEDGSGASGAC